MNIKKSLRLIAVILFIVIACLVPVPMTFKRKDNLPKHLTEQIDEKKDTNEITTKKEAFG